MIKAVGLVVFSLWCASLFLLYSYGEGDVEDLLTDSLIDNARNIDELLDIAIAYNVSIKDQMESNVDLIRKNKYFHPLVSQLKDFPELKSYGLKGDEKVNGQGYRANLTGAGSLSDVSNEIIGEIDAALSLNLLTPLDSGYHDFIWSYYTSKNGFVLLAPNVFIDDFQFSESLYSKLFWTVANPENNSSRKTVISDLDDDAGGQGLMISISTPVYQGDTFYGVVSLDVGLAYLSNAMTSLDQSLDNNIYIITSEGKIAVNSIEKKIGKNLLNIPTHYIGNYGVIQQSGKYYVLSRPIKEKFHVAYELNPQELRRLILKNTYSWALILALFGMIIWLFSSLYYALNRTRRLAQYDGLSHLYNRMTLELLSTKQADLALKNETPISVMMIDIDNFKSLNDTYGHQVGDEGIRHVSMIIKYCVRKSDIAGRYGGEEFLVTLPETNLERANSCAEKIRKSIEQLNFGDDNSVTVSIGIAEMDASMGIESFQALCEKADFALYYAKDNGRNCTIGFSAEIEKYNKRTK